MPDNADWVREELVIHIDNTESLSINKTRDFWGNLKKKLGKGVYDPKKAEVLFKYLADRSAKDYDKTHKLKNTFTPNDRRAVAKRLREDFEDEMKYTGYMTKTGKPTQKATLEAMTKVQRTKYLKGKKLTQKSLDSSASRNSPRRVSERGYSVN